MKVSKVSIVAMVGIALMFILAGNVEACDYRTLYGCSAAQTRWIIKDKSTKASIERATIRKLAYQNKQNRLAYRKAEKNQRRGRSTIVHRSDGTWTEIRHARRR